MKTSKIDKSPSSNSRSSKPFFNKSGEGVFYSQSQEMEKPFFDPLVIQRKLNDGEKDDYEFPPDYVGKDPDRQNQADEEDDYEFPPDYVGKDPDRQNQTDKDCKVNGYSETDLRQDMDKILDRWLNGSRAGVSQFINGVLSKRIDKIEEGDWKSFWVTLLGNSIAAATVFLSGGTAFAVGIIVGTGQSVPAIPKKSSKNSDLSIIEGGIHKYFEEWHAKLLKKTPKKAKEFYKMCNLYSPNEMIERFLKYSFKRQVITISSNSRDRSTLNQTKVREETVDVVKYLFDLSVELSNKTGGPTATFGGPVSEWGKYREVAWLVHPTTSTKPWRLAVVEIDRNYYSGKIKSMKFVRFVKKGKESLAIHTMGKPIPKYSYEYIMGQSR